MVCIGDKVKVIREGGIFATYTRFMTEYVARFNSEHTRHISAAYREGTYPTAEALSHDFTVEYVARHDIFNTAVAIISSERGNVYICNADALAVVTPVSYIHVGDKVTISDPSHVYSGWEQLIESQKGIIPASAVDRWKAGREPEKGMEGTVLWVGKHVSRPHEDTLYIVEAQSGVFILGSEALDCVHRDWEKYLVYVRNWSVKHRDDSPNLGASPLSYAGWLANHKADNFTI